MSLLARLRMIIASAAMVGGLAFAPALVPSSVSAAPVDVLTACDNKSTVCKGTNANTLTTLIKNVINLLLYVIGIIAVIMIIIGGIRYVTSAGDAAQTKGARDTILYAVIGLIVAIMAFAIVNWVVSRL